MFQVRQLRVDHGLTARPGMEHPALRDLDPVGGHAQSAIGAGKRIYRSLRQAVTNRDNHLVQRRGRHRCDLRQVPERPGEPARARPGGEDQNLGGIGPPQQPRVSSISAAGAGSGGQHHPADQAEQHGQAHQRPPPQPHIRPQAQPHRSHTRIQLPAPIGGQGSSHHQHTVVLIRTPRQRSPAPGIPVVMSQAHSPAGRGGSPVASVPSDGIRTCDLCGRGLDRTLDRVAESSTLANRILMLSS